MTQVYRIWRREHWKENRSNGFLNFLWYVKQFQYRLLCVLTRVFPRRLQRLKRETVYFENFSKEGRGRREKVDFCSPRTKKKIAILLCLRTKMISKVHWRVAVLNLRIVWILYFWFNVYFEGYTNFYFRFFFPTKYFYLS